MNDRLPGRLILAAIGAVVVVLVVVAVVIALQPPPVLDPATPEGTAQGYFEALHDRDADRVAAYLTDDLNDRCDPPVYLADFFRYDERDTTGVSIVNTEVDGDTATVEVAITVTYGSGPFSSGSETVDDALIMEHHGDRWLIAEPAWPMDRFMCETDA